MATRCGRMFNNTSISIIKSSISRTPLSREATTSFTRSSLPSKSAASTLRRFSRLPAELGAVASMLPLHSAVATARMTSCLSASSGSCRALFQGTLCCTSPDL